MKLLKVLSTSAVAAALLASMAVSANADGTEELFDINAVDDTSVENVDEEIALGGGHVTAIREDNDDPDDFGDWGTEDLLGDEGEVLDGDGDFENLDDVDGDGFFGEDGKDEGKGSGAVADFEDKHDGDKDDDFFTDGFGDFDDKKDGIIGDDWWFDKEEEVAGNNYDVIDVVNHARDAGVNSVNVQTLRNFLILNDAFFTADDYADFISAVDEVRDLYIKPLSESVFYKGPANLTESERHDLYTLLSAAEKDAIQAKLLNLAADKNILITFDIGNDGFPVAYASMRTVKSNDSKAADNSSTAGTATNGAVKSTGALPESASTNGAAAFAGVALALAAAGVVVVARKNRA